MQSIYDMIYQLWPFAAGVAIWVGWHFTKDEEWGRSLGTSKGKK